jgi:hypothetical protein
MRDLASYKGKTVIVVGQNIASDEGSWLLEDCKGKVSLGGNAGGPTISLSYSPDPHTPPPLLPAGFRWNKKTLARKLRHVRDSAGTEKPRGEDWWGTWLAVYGRLETGPWDMKFQTLNGTMEVVHNVLGYGHLNSSVAQLVWPKNGMKTLR